MLLALLKNVSKWVFDLFMNNKIADAEARLYSDWFQEEVDDEGL
jgi:hypothetical protein